MKDWTVHLPAGAEPGSVGLHLRGTLPSAWARWFSETPGRRAFLGRDGERTLTYGDLDAGSRRFASHLAGEGLTKGDRMLLSANTSIEMILAYIGAQRLGVVVVPASNALTRSEMDHIVDDARPSAAFVDDPVRAGWLRDISSICGPATEFAEREAPELDQVEPDDLALIAYTSGTTGAPKGAMLSSANLFASAEALRIAWRWTCDDVLVLALPLFHMHGLGVGVNGTLLSGACAVLLPKFGVDEVHDVIAGERATLFFGVPTMYLRLAASARAAELAKLRLAVSGSAPLSPDLHIELQRLTRGKIIERYGMTETVITISNPYDGDRRPGSVGLPLPGVEVEIDQTGELLIRGPSVFKGYWNRPEETASSFTGDGWFRTGDLAEQDDDGYLRIVGRIKELIITGGYNVYPREVEDVLRRHPQVNDVAVAGLPSEEWGETVAAWVVSDGHIDAEDLIAFASRHLAPYKRPRLINVVDELPRNSLGKVVKRFLPTP